VIKDAITTLKEKTGSNHYAIVKFIEEKNQQLPSNFRKFLLYHLKKLVAARKRVKVKRSFKISPTRPSVSSPAKKDISCSVRALRRLRTACEKTKRTLLPLLWWRMCFTYWLVAEGHIPLTISILLLPF